eukprot:g6318.t1
MPVNRGSAVGAATTGGHARAYTERELAAFDGSQGAPGLYVAVGGLVFDVEANGAGGRAFYGPGAGYAAFAGRACSRGVALPSLEEADVSDDVRDFDGKQRQRLEHWIRFFKRKYVCVGTLKAASAAERADLAAERSARAGAARAARAAARRNNAAANTSRRFSAGDLASHDGQDPSLPLLMAVGGHVFDVSASANLYGPGGPRGMYAGRAVTRALTLQSVRVGDLSDRIDDFSHAQRATMVRRIDFFLGRYPKVGVLEGETVAAKEQAGQAAKLARQDQSSDQDPVNPDIEFGLGLGV